MSTFICILLHWFLCMGQKNGDLCTLIECASYPNFPAVVMDYLPADRKSEAIPFYLTVAGGIAAVKTFKDLFCIFLLDADPVVGKGKHNAMFAVAKGN